MFGMRAEAISVSATVSALRDATPIIQTERNANE
jgi:hypothetical protein